jgi:hypothetical protein
MHTFHSINSYSLGVYIHAKYLTSPSTRLPNTTISTPHSVSSPPTTTMRSFNMLTLLLPIFTTLPSSLAQDQAISDAESTASGNTLNTSTQAPAEATSAAQSAASSIASEAFSSALSSAASSISESVAQSPSATPTTGAAGSTKGMLFVLFWILVLPLIRGGMYANGLLDAQFAAVVGGGLAVAAGWFV